MKKPSRSHTGHAKYPRGVVASEKPEPAPSRTAKAAIGPQAWPRAVAAGRSFPRV
jgi:hypothetical protein